MNVKSFKKWVKSIPGVNKGKNVDEQDIWIVLVPFFDTLFVKYFRYLPGYETPLQGKQTLQHLNNAVSEQKPTSGIGNELRDFSIISVKAMHNINYGEDVFLNYSSNSRILHFDLL